MDDEAEDDEREEMLDDEVEREVLYIALVIHSNEIVILLLVQEGRLHQIEGTLALVVLWLIDDDIEGRRYAQANEDLEVLEQVDEVVVFIVLEVLDVNEMLDELVVVADDEVEVDFAVLEFRQMEVIDDEEGYDFKAI